MHGENLINFEKIGLAEKTEDTVEFITNEFSTYAIFAYSSIQDDKVNIYDYDSDYNYYMGKNYTDNNAGTNQKLYTADNLAEVTINYYGYDYSKDIHETRTFNIVPTWSNQSNQNSGGYRNYTIRLTANSSNTQIIDNKQNWQMSFTLPQSASNSFQIDRTQNNNSNLNFSYDSNTYTVTVSGNNWNEWAQNSLTSYQLDIILTFSGTVSINNVSNLNITAVEKNIVGYVSADENERQCLFTYIKCMPITNGNISFELIDNPYMDRPAGFGFDGWTTNETGYNFSINNENNVQTLTVNTNGSKEITINLYVNWQEAKIIFIDTDARNSGNGLTVDTPVNSWNNANTALGTTRNAQNASDRELNILVLINGTLTNLNALNNKAYTLTSLYDGIDYRNNNTRLNLTNNFTLGNDLQLDYLNVTGSTNYTSTTATNTINRYINGSARNLRIGRGMMPLTVQNTTTTFAQVLGGGNASRAYKLVIESGKYANIQTTGTSSTTQTIFANMTLGCDYDRVTSTDTNLYVYNRTATRSGAGTLTPRVSGKPLFEIIVKSGTFGMDYFNGKTGDFAFSGIYLGGHSSGTDNGDRIMIVEGGTIANILGGLAIQSNTSTVKTCIYVKGGNVQNIVGGAGVSTTRGDRTIQITDGNVAYSVSGGSNGYTAGQSGSANPTGQLVGDTLLYIGGNAIIGTADITSSLYNVNAGCVLGAGDGNNTLPETAGKVDSTHVIIDGNAYIANSVYGGGNYGVVGESSDVNQGGSGNPLITITNESSNIISGDTYLISTGTNNNSSLLTADGNNISNSTLNDTRIPGNNEEWIVRTSGNGYTFQNSSTGRYLTIEQQEQYYWGSYYYSYDLTTSNTPSVFTYSNNRLYMTFQESSRWGTNNVNSYLYYNYGWSADTNSGSNIYFLKYEKIPQTGETEDPTPLATKVVIDIFGGTIGNDIYGGANQNDIYGSVDINMYNGNVNGTIYGGSNTRRYNIWNVRYKY